MKAFFDDIANRIFPDPRVKALRRLADKNNWLFKHRSQMEEEAPELEKLELFKGRRDKRMIGIMTTFSDQVTGKFRIYDYLYFGDLGKKQTTVFEFYNEQLDLVNFDIRPKGTFGMMKDYFVASESPFATTPEFRERYLINTADESELRFDLNEDFLDHVGDEPGWNYEGLGNCMIAYQSGKPMLAADITSNFHYFQAGCERLVNGRSSAEFV